MVCCMVWYNTLDTVIIYYEQLVTLSVMANKTTTSKMSVFTSIRVLVTQILATRPRTYGQDFHIQSSDTCHVHYPGKSFGYTTWKQPMFGLLYKGFGFGKVDCR